MRPFAHAHNAALIWFFGPHPFRASCIRALAPLHACAQPALGCQMRRRGEGTGGHACCESAQERAAGDLAQEAKDSELEEYLERLNLL